MTPEPCYLKQLNRILDDLFAEAAARKWTWATFARHAGVSENTVYRLGHRETRFPQLRTVVLLALALGNQLALAKLDKIKAKSRKAG